MKQKMLIFLFLLVGISFSLSAQVENKIPRLRISTSGGLGYLTATGDAKVDGVISKEKLDQLENSLHWATHLNGDVHYFFRSGLGIGVKYIFHKSSGEALDVVIDPFDAHHYVVADLWEKDYINYTGLSLGGISSIGTSNKLFLNSSLSAGYMWVRGELSVLYQNVLLTGSNIAMNGEIGLDYLVHPNLGIGVNMGAFWGYVNKVKLNNGFSTTEQKLDKESRYNASNINLTVGLRYYLNR